MSGPASRRRAIGLGLIRRGCQRGESLCRAAAGHVVALPLFPKTSMVMPETNEPGMLGAVGPRLLPYTWRARVIVERMHPAWLSAMVGALRTIGARVVPVFSPTSKHEHRGHQQIV